MDLFLKYSAIAIGVFVIFSAFDRLNVYPTSKELEMRASQHAISLEKDLPPKQFVQDGCTLFPNKLPWHDLRDACLQHDIVYWLGGTKEERRAADVAFRETISHTGPAGPVIAYPMYVAVSIFGDSWLTKLFDTNWGYGWNE